MLTEDDAQSYLEHVAAELQELTYEELERYARSHDMLGDWQTREFVVDGETVEVNTMISELGPLRKRMSVEMTLAAEGDTGWTEVPCVYFERYKSGRLHVVVTTKWENALGKALPYVFITAVVIGLAALVWNRFLRVE